MPQFSTGSPPDPAADKSIGIVYIATGEKYVRATLNSAESVKKHCNNLKVHLFTDLRDFSHENIDGVSMIENPHRRSKIDYLFKTPFERTLYLDSDTRIIDNITDVFSLLDKFDIALAHAHSRNHPATTEQWKNNIPYSFPQLNGGVILFKMNARVESFLKQWCEAYHTAGFKKDQVTLRELIWNSDLRLTILPPEYNIRYKKYLWIWRKNEAVPKIMHLKKYLFIK
jgi:hypothetical protein